MDCLNHGSFSTSGGRYLFPLIIRHLTLARRRKSNKNNKNKILKTYKPIKEFKQEGRTPSSFPSQSTQCATFDFPSSLRSARLSA